jgi:hypothetical protein
MSWLALVTTTMVTDDDDDDGDDDDDDAPRHNAHAHADQEVSDPGGERSRAAHATAVATHSA